MVSTTGNQSGRDIDTAQIEERRFPAAGPDRRRERRPGDLRAGLRGVLGDRARQRISCFRDFGSLLEWKPPYAAWYLGGTLNACYKPGVRRIRDAAELTGDDVWITMTIPGDFEGAQGDPAPGAEAIRQWTSVVLHAMELTWLREMLALNSAGEETCG